MRSRLLAAALLLACGSARAQHVQVEKYTLANGVKVILHRDDRLPVATINTWFYVGAKDEPRGRSGFAHLFEHLMFMGTERVPTGQFDQIMEVAGGSNNASTEFDHTDYYSVGPSEILPTLLWLDAERLEDLGRTMTQEKLDKQRDIVRNERRETTENVPYGKSELAMIAMLFPGEHPYHNEVIGTHEDLESAQLQDVKEFFANFYVPNNASLVVAGAFDPAEIKPRIEELFGSLPRGAPPPRRMVAPPQLGGELRFTTIDKVEEPMLRFAWLSPTAYSDGDAEMELVAGVLGSEKSGRLYRRLVIDEELASDVSASQQSMMLSSLFEIDVVARAGADLEKIERIVDEEIGRLVKQGAEESELERLRAQSELDVLRSLESIESKADKLNEYEFFFGDPDSFERDLQRYAAATADRVTQVAKKVLATKERVIVRVLPESPEHAVSARDRAQEALAPRPFTPPAPQTFALSNGIDVELFERPELPKVEMLLTLSSGPGGFDRKGFEGEADLLADMLDEGTGDLDAVAFADALERLGADFRADADRDGISIELSSLKRTFPQSLQLAANAVLEPTLGDDDFGRVKALHLEEIQQRRQNPNAVARQVAARELFGAGHPYATPLAGTLESAGKVDLAGVKALHARAVAPRRGRIYVSGAIGRDELKTALEGVFAGWKDSGAPEPLAVLPPIPASDHLRVLLVDRKDAVQTVILFQLPGIRLADDRRVPYRMVSIVLGESFTSRLVQKLREEKGYTYGARSRFDLDPFAGTFTASSAVRADVTGVALKEFLAQLTMLRGGDLTDVEAKRAAAQFRSDSIQDFSRLEGTLRAASTWKRAGLDLSLLAKDLEAAPTFDAGKLNAAAREALRLDEGVLVLVGDAARVKAQLAEQGLPAPTQVGAEEP